MNKIIGKDKLEKIFGQWPSFHDAEIQQIILKRYPENDMRWPTLQIIIHLLEITKGLNKNNFVTFIFTKINELVLENFNHQNVIFALKINELTDSENNDQKFNVIFESAYGCDLSFQCNTIEIESVKSYHE
ncbi:MAG: Imm50 family immunity protein [Patescibacteria group bacterium]|jgi:hypothetical protein